MMNFKNAYTPILDELVQVENEMKISLRDLGFSHDKDGGNKFSEYRISHICSALLLLSAKSVNQDLSEEMNEQIVRMGAAMEFVYNAVIVHNNLSEKDEIKLTSNNKVSILGGDILYTLAFLMASKQFSNKFMQKIAHLTEEMCLAEIEQRRDNIYSVSHDRYSKVIEGKTASFMASCCRFGAELAGAGEIEAECLENFGLNFGMAYQIMADNAGQLNTVGEDAESSFTSLKEAEKFIDEAMLTLNDVPDSSYKAGLLKLLKYAASPVSNYCISN